MEHGLKQFPSEAVKDAEQIARGHEKFGTSGSPREWSRPTFGLRSAGRLVVLALLYIVVLLVAHWSAYLIRFEFHPPQEHRAAFWRLQAWILPVELILLSIFGQFRSMLSYFSLPDARSIIFACLGVGLISTVLWYATKGAASPARSIVIMSVLLDTSILICLRLIFRMVRESRKGPSKTASKRRRVVIIGAGDVGANLAKEMMSRRALGMYPVAFFDDDRKKWNTYVHGVPVLGRVELLIGMGVEASEAIIAMPSASVRRVREVVQVLSKVQLKSEIVPSVEQIVNGDVRVSQIRAVEIEDLLGRERVSIQTDKIDGELRDKVVFVTGAGGSIGSELCRQILSFAPKHLVLIERCEVLIFQIEQELIQLGFTEKITPFVADVLNVDRLRECFSRFRPHLVFHAAAHKHVPMMEHQPFEAFYNNTVGTKIIADLSVEFGASRFVLVSSDKAINPTNSMGATKRLAELYIQAMQTEITGITKFSAVRFGNVLGSSGSVIPTFKKQISAGGPITVTHPDITRYFMTVHEAVGLVLQSSTQAQGGEIFVLDMGTPVKIVDIAKQLIELSGFRPGVDIEIKFTGLRPGEKLYEELTHASEEVVPTDHSKIWRFLGKPSTFEFIQNGIANLREVGIRLEPDEVKSAMRQLVPEYAPFKSGSSDPFRVTEIEPDAVRVRNSA